MVYLVYGVSYISLVIILSEPWYELKKIFNTSCRLCMYLPKRCLLHAQHGLCILCELGPRENVTTPDR